MRGVNKAVILGTIGKDPDVKYTAGGAAVVNVSVATNDKWKDKNTGQDVEKVEWHRIVIFGKLAEVAAQYLKKGGQVYFEGKIQTRKWQDQSGQDRYSTEVVVDGFSGTMQMLGGKSDNQQGQQPAQQHSNQTGGIAMPDKAHAQQSSQREYSDQSMEDD